jgi:hypothetical protein
VNVLPLQNTVELFPLARHSETRSDHTAVLSSMHSSLLCADHKIDTGVVQRIPNARREERRMKGAAETFSFLGFTHICAKTQAGRFLLARHTEKKRMRVKLREVKAEMQRRRHQPIPEQGRWLGQVVRGYFAYHAVPTNAHALAAFRSQLIRTWHRALRRRGQRDRTDWARMKDLEQRWIPQARVQHPWPEERFDVRTQGKSPVR